MWVLLFLLYFYGLDREAAFQRVFSLGLIHQRTLRTDDGFADCRTLPPRSPESFLDAGSGKRVRLDLKLSGSSGGEGVDRVQCY